MLMFIVYPRHSKQDLFCFFFLIFFYIKKMKMKILKQKNLNIFSTGLGLLVPDQCFYDPDWTRSIQENPVHSSPHVTAHLSESMNLESLSKRTHPPVAVSNLSMYLLVI